MKLLVAGVARNLEHVWYKTQQSLQYIFDAVDTYECIIIESNSQDNTSQILDSWAKEDSRRKIIHLGNLTEQSRTRRIAQCRNEYMKFVRETDSAYTLVVDLDTSLNIESKFKQQLESCFLRDDWDAIASNRRGRYYDVWALRSQAMGCTFDCWAELNKPIVPRVSIFQKQQTNRLNFYIGRFQQVIPENTEWIKCESAFGCMVLYRTDAIRNHLYNGDITCEHVSFNNGLRIYINPKFISGGECPEHYHGI